MLLNFNLGSLEYTTEEHYHYVQGVAWDPLGIYCVSQSADKSFKVFSCEAVQQIKGIKGKIPGMTLNLQAEVTKAEVPISNLENGTDGKPAKVYFFFHLFMYFNQLSSELCCSFSLRERLIPFFKMKIFLLSLGDFAGLQMDP